MTSSSTDLKTKRQRSVSPSHSITWARLLKKRLTNRDLEDVNIRTEIWPYKRLKLKWEPFKHQYLTQKRREVRKLVSEINFSQITNKGNDHFIYGWQTPIKILKSLWLDSPNCPNQQVVSRCIDYANHDGPVILKIVWEVGYKPQHHEIHWVPVEL